MLVHCPKCGKHWTRDCECVPRVGDLWPSPYDPDAGAILAVIAALLILGLIVLATFCC